MKKKCRRAIASGPDPTCLRAENESPKRTFKLHFKHKAETGVPNPGYSAQ